MLTLETVVSKSWTTCFDAAKASTAADASPLKISNCLECLESLLDKEFLSFRILSSSSFISKCSSRIVFSDVRKLVFSSLADFSSSMHSVFSSFCESARSAFARLCSSNMRHLISSLLVDVLISKFSISNTSILSRMSLFSRSYASFSSISFKLVVAYCSL